MLLHGLAVAFACMIGAGAKEGNHGLHFADAMAHARLLNNQPAPIREMRFRLLGAMGGQVATDSLQSAVSSACKQSSHLCSAWITSCNPGLDTTVQPSCRIDLLPPSSSASDSSRQACPQPECRAADGSRSNGQPGAGGFQDGGHCEGSRDLHVVLSLAPAYHMDNSEVYSSLAGSLQEHLTAAGINVEVILLQVQLQPEGIMLLSQLGHMGSIPYYVASRTVVLAESSNWDASRRHRNKILPCLGIDFIVRYTHGRYVVQIEGSGVYPWGQRHEDALLRTLWRASTSMDWGEQFTHISEVHQKGAGVQVTLITNAFPQAVSLDKGIEAAQHLLQSSFQATGANATFSVLSLARADGESIQDQVYRSLATAAAAATKTHRLGSSWAGLWPYVSGLAVLALGCYLWMPLARATPRAPAMPPLPTQKLLLTSTNGAGQLAKRRSEDCRPPRQPSPQSPHEALFNPFDSELKFSDDSAYVHNPGRKRKVDGSRLEASELEICRRPDGSRWLLGTGGFGQVFKALKGGVSEVAVKEMCCIDVSQMHAFENEVALLQSLTFDRNIVQFYGACLNGSRAWLVMEYLEGGDLRSAISRSTAGEFDWYHKGASLLLDVVRGLIYLHSHNVVHLDLKTRNILLSGDHSKAKLADVGLSRVVTSTLTSSSSRHPMGTFAYTAPEVLLGERCTPAADLWSFGVVLWEVVTKEVPLRGQLRRPDTPQECPAEIADLIDACLERPISQRPSARAVHDIIKRLLDQREPQEGASQEAT